MTSPSPKPTSTNSMHTLRALATVEAFLQVSNCPEYTINLWLYLKERLIELSTTQSTLTTSAQDETLKSLSAIKKKLSTHAPLSPKPTTYADSARLAAPLSTQEKPVSSRAPKKVLVKVIGDPKPTQTSGRLVESINAARSSRAGQVLAAQKLESGDILITAD